MRYLLILFLLYATVTMGQNSFTGKVTDSETGEPLYLANVLVTETGTGATTGRNGIFSIVAEPGNTLRISYVGYETKIVEVSEHSDTDVIEVSLVKKILSSQTVLIKGTIGQEGETPITFSKISREEIEDNYINQDIPEYLSYLPSTTFYSEGGAGLGYNYLSIRGFDQRRISISVNGVPQNEPEDHNLYWLDLPDLLGSTGLIQVQRGAGSGVTGYPAIGGSINIITSPFTSKPQVELGTTFGSYNFRKYEVTMSSGIIDNKYSVYARMTNTLSSGYRDLNWIDFKSYHLAAVRYDEDFTTQINIYGGPVADGLTYTGLPKWAIEDKEERKKNYSYWSDENGEYTYTTVRRPEEKENFFQPHFELLNEWNANENLTFNSALFLIIGDGFFDYDGSWAPLSYFRITEENGFDIDGDPSEIYMSNTLIRAMVENKQWGWIPRMSWKHDKGTLVAGAEFRTHRSVHWGGIQYANGIPAGVPEDYRYYYYEGGKDIMSAFLHEEYNLTERINVLVETQLSYFNYMIENERYLNNEFEVSDVFFNPRAGINYKLTPETSAYFSFARVTREPRLKNYYDAAESGGGEIPQFERNADGSFNFDEPLVRPETMNSFDLGVNYNTERMDLSLNGYYMMFEDEIVKEGQVDRFGQPVTGNMDETVHMGLEAAGTFRVNDWLDITLNGTYSKNYITEGSTYLSLDDGTHELDLTDNRISGFPNMIFNGIIGVHKGGFVSQLTMKYVGEFYSDNYDDNLGTYLEMFPGFTDYNDNVVDAYFTANLLASYEIEAMPLFKSLKFYGQVYNIFDNLYATYAIGKEFFPAAPRYFQVGIKAGL